MGHKNSTMHTSVCARFKFNNFDQQIKNGVATSSAEQTDCNGNRWQLVLYPGGFKGYPGYMSLCLLCSRREGKMTMRFSRMTFITRRGTDIIFEKQRRCICSTDNLGAKRYEYFTWEMGALSRGKYDRSDIDETMLPQRDGSKFVLGDFVKHSNASDLLHKGALFIDVIIEAEQDIDSSIIPKNPTIPNMLKLLDSGNMSDVSFDVDGEIMHAHKFVLAVNAPLLAEFCNKSSKGSPVLIDGVSPEIFRRVLRYIYGEEAPTDETEVLRIGFDLIRAANRFCLTDLKLKVESALVEITVFSVNNVSKYILFADAMICPLLKERAVSYFITRPKDVLKSESSAELRESAGLMQELLLARVDHDEDLPMGNMNMPVERLREMLREKKLDLDGSKEALLLRLESA